MSRPAVSARLPDGTAIRRVAAELLFKTPGYRLSLRGRHPVQLSVKPEELWPGDEAVADALFRGAYRFAGEAVTLTNQPPWLAKVRSEEWLAAMHGFAWLRDFATAGGDAARRQARALVASWLEHCGEWDALTWRPDVTGRRLVAWVTHARFFLDDTIDTVTRRLRF